MNPAQLEPPVQIPEEAKSWKIAHVFPNHAWGGAEIQMVELAQWQTEAGLDVTVWCKEDSPIYKEAQRRGLKCITDCVPFKATIPPLWKLVPVVKRHGFTHIHIHWATGIRVFMGIKLFCPVKLIFYTHMWITKNKKDPLHALAYKQIDKWTVSGPRAKDAVLKHLPVRDEQLEFVSYGIDFRQQPKNLRVNGRPRPGLRSEWGLPEEALVFGFFGRIDRQKGVAEFVKALGPLLKEFPNLHLMMVGDPTLNEEDALKYKQEVDALIEAIPEKDRIHRFGHQRDFHTPLACCDLLVLPSYMESYSILIAHSFSLGIPVVSTNAGGTPDLVQPPLRGWLVPSRSVSELQETVREIARNPEAIRAKREACERYATENHSHTAVVKRFIEIYS